MWVIARDEKPGTDLAEEREVGGGSGERASRRHQRPRPAGSQLRLI